MALLFVLVLNSLPAQTTTASSSREAEEAVKLSPFDVTETKDRGYIASNSVSATKVNTPVSDIPSSVIILSRNLIDDLSPTKPLDLLKRASGITENFNTSDRFVLRGQMNMGFVRDGFATRFIRSDFNNVQQVEVLKGVQGVLYGSVGLAGLVNLVSKTPTFENRGSVTMTIGDGNLVAGSLDYDRRLSARTAVRAVLSGLTEEPQVFDGLHNKRSNVFGSVSHRFTQRLSFTGIVEYVYVDESLLGGTWFDPATGKPVRNGEFVRRNSSLAGDSYFTDEGLRTNLRFDADLAAGWSARLVFSNYDQTFVRRQTDSRFAPLPANGNLTRIDAAYLTEGDFSDVTLDVSGDFETGALRHRPVFGASGNRVLNDDTIWVWNTFSSNIATDSSLRSFGTRAPYWFTQLAQNRTYNYGAYVMNTTSMLEEKLQFVYGVRHAVADQSGGLLNLGLPPDTTSVAPYEKESLPNSAMTRTRTSDNLVRFGVVYKPRPNLSLYGSFNDTYYPINRIAQDRNGSLRPFPAETGKVTEVGVKSELFDGQVVLNASYYWNRRGPFVFFDAAANLFKEAPATPINGFEFDLNAYINRSWSVILAYSNTQVDGVAAVSVPEYSWSVWSKYEFQDGPLKGFAFGAGLDYMTDRSLFISPLRGDARTLLDAMLSYRVNNRWSVALNATNVTDKFYILHDSGGYDAVVPGDPRRVRLTTTFRF